MGNIVSIRGLDKAKVLYALYVAARPVGNGYFVSSVLQPLSVEEARLILQKTQSFDYIRGRSVKVDLSGDEFDASLYDRDNGTGKAARVIAGLR